MKYIVFLLLISTVSFAQRRPAKADTVTLSAYQLQVLTTLEKEIAEIQKTLDAKQENRKQFINGILSTYGEPEKLKLDFKQPNKLIISKP